MQNVCRGCLKPNDEKCAFYSSISNDESLKMMFTAITNLKVVFADGLPEYICNICIDALHIAHEFKQKCLASDIHLKNCIAEKASKGIIEESSTTDSVDVEQINNTTKCSTSKNVTSNVNKTTAITKCREKYPCTDCHHVSVSLKDFSNHLKVHDTVSQTELYFSCDFCNMKFKYLELLTTHQKKLHNSSEKQNELNFHCNDCPESFETMKQLDEHQTLCSSQTALFECNKCIKTFTALQSFMKHMNKMHKGVDLEHKYVCKMCKRKFAYKTLLDHHVRAHPEKEQEESVPCPYCGKSFQTSQKVNLHIRAIHDNEKRHKCDECDKEYFYYNALKSHKLRQHEKRANFICTICGKTFFAAGDLNVHMRRHTGNSRYTCTTGQCNKKFSQLSELKFHIRSKHTGERDFRCTKCVKTFITNQHLKQHFDRNHLAEPRERKHICTNCKKGFFTKYSLTKHYRNVHKMSNYSTHGNATIHRQISI